MTHYPVFLNLTGLTVALIGEAAGVNDRVPHLEAAGATIRRVEPNQFLPEHLDGASLVICATFDEPLNARVSAAPRGRRLFFQVLDRPARWSWLAPAGARPTAP